MNIGVGTISDRYLISMCFESILSSWVQLNIKKQSL